MADMPNMSNINMTEVNQKFRHHVSGNRGMQIGVGVLMMLLGVLFFVFPLAAIFFANIFIIIGLAILGIYLIVTFIALPS